MKPRFLDTPTLNPGAADSRSLTPTLPAGAAVDHPGKVRGGIVGRITDCFKGRKRKPSEYQVCECGKNAVGAHQWTCPVWLARKGAEA